MKHFITSLIVLFYISNVQAQQTTQTIRGTIVDKQSQLPLVGAKISIVNSDPIKGAVTDANGKFSIIDVIPGRYDLKAEMMGYKETTLSNIIVTTGKEIVLDVMLEEKVTSMTEVSVKAKRNTMNNTLTTVSGRAFTMEEVNRYAGGRSDPARMAANFAGVSSPDDSRNDLIIRGNSPIGVLYRIEGLNIPNPNHFSTVEQRVGL
jgi:hypothetical protein